MNILMLILLLLPFSTFAQQHEQNFPSFKNEKNLKSIVKQRKIKVGFIDLGRVEWSTKNYEKYRSKQENVADTPEGSIHGHLVVSSFIKKIEELKIWKTPSDHVEIVYCGMDYLNEKTSEKDFLNFKSCMEWMKDQNIDLMNFSATTKFFISSEFELLKNLTSNGVVITTAAGNYKKDSSNLQSCNTTLNNTICVGSIDETGRLASFSNFGPFVNVYELGEETLDYRTEQKKVFGTSFSAPLHLARYIQLRLKNKHSSYYSNFAKNLKIKRFQIASAYINGSKKNHE